MSSESVPNKSRDSTGDSEIGNNEGRERFAVAVDRVYKCFEDWGREHGLLNQAAQNYDFISSQEELDGAIRQEAANHLVDAITGSEAPEEIVQIYRELYADVIEEVTQMRADEEGVQA